jgi:hypothetical protein
MSLLRAQKIRLKMSDKYLVTSGCSYSDVSLNAWPKHINNFLPNLSTINKGASSRGNDYISRTIINSVQSLLKKGIDPKKIFVLGCWSGMQRHDILINNQSVKMHYELKEHYNEIHQNKNFIGDWMIFSEKWWKIIPDEQSYIISLENILRTQWFLQNNHINYHFFTFVNTFAYYNYSEFWKDNHFDKDKTKTISEVFPSTKYLWDMIDWNKWWFSNQNYDGLGNWILQNVKGGYDENELGGIMGHNHPTKKGHLEFCKKIIIPILRKNFDD